MRPDPPATKRVSRIASALLTRGGFFVFEQSTADFEQLQEEPIFMEVMQQGPRDAARVEAVLVAVLESVLEVCKQEGLPMEETYWLLELHARVVIGAQIALYLDRMINPDQREEMKHSLLSAAEAISQCRQTGREDRADG